jgi:hypothetical protein
MFEINQKKRLGLPSIGKKALLRVTWLAVTLAKSFWHFGKSLEHFASFWQKSDIRYQY